VYESTTAESTTAKSTASRINQREIKRKPNQAQRKQPWKSGASAPRQAPL
jgi:hypothetical protein